MPVARAAERSTRWSRATDGPLLVAAVAFLVVLLVPLYRPDLPDEVLEALRVANVALWLVFGVDYAVRLLLAPDRRAYVRGHLADLATLAVPFLRPLRLLRLVRVAGLLGTATRRASGRALLTTTGTWSGSSCSSSSRAGSCSTPLRPPRRSPSCPTGSSGSSGTSSGSQPREAVVYPAREVLEQLGRVTIAGLDSTCNARYCCTTSTRSRSRSRTCAP
ncbi:MAG: hypothetical protein M3P95_02755 [Actinomycetota bacterium]|nr:hypothetical protein [Actinomycetota bacterium]